MTYPNYFFQKIIISSISSNAYPNCFFQKV